MFLPEQFSLYHLYGQEENLLIAVLRAFPAAAELVVS